MSTNLLRRHALEAVDYQGTALFDALTEAFETLRAQNRNLDTKAIQAAGIPAIVFAHTQMLISFNVDPAAQYDAYIRVPLVDKNHPFVDNEIRHWHLGELGPAVIRAMGGSVMGTVDVARGRVGGIYSKMQGDITFGNTLVTDKRFTVQELAGFMLHELGHMFTYFELLRTTVTASNVIAYTAKAVFEIEDAKKRTDCLKEAADVLGIDLYSPEKIATSTKAGRAEYVQTILISAHANKCRSEGGFSVYEYRSSEQMADMFASKHGAGSHVITGLDKLYRLCGNTALQGVGMFMFMELVKLVSYMLLMVTSMGLPFWLVLLVPKVNVYDDPKDRIISMRRTINDSLKSTTLPKETRVAMLADIEVLSKLEVLYNDRRSFTDVLNTALNSVSRQNYKQQLVQKEVEALINNDLFAKSAALSVVAE